VELEIVNRVEPKQEKKWSFEIMLEKIGADPNYFTPEWIANEKKRCREYWQKNAPNYKSHE
jgi:hypothetical protein